MARNRSVDFLPELFRTDTNKEFLSATLDQLVQEPKLKRIEGYIGNKLNSLTNNDDRFLLEPNIERSNYQLEPGVTFNDENNQVENAITYPEIIDVLKTEGADVSRHDRLFSSEIYSWSPLIDLDKFTNHGQYYWLPNGPDSVNVSATDILITNDYTITRTNNGYEFSGVGGSNPTLTLARGGTYNFDVNQSGNNFFIQTEQGISGTQSFKPNVSSRDVFGVTNNGEDGGTVTFAVPDADAQKFYHNLTSITDIDLATLTKFEDIDGETLSSVEDIDGVTDLQNKTIIFLDSTAGDSTDLGWVYEDTTTIDSQADRYSMYRISYSSASDPVLSLNKIKEISIHEKFNILYGDVYSGLTYYKNSSGYFEKVPLLTASSDVLYYQDSNDTNIFGVINLVDNVSEAYLDVTNDIVGATTYISPNGIEFTNGLKVIFRGNVTPTSYQDQEYYVEGVGTSIVLIPVSELITPETYTSSATQPYDSNPFDSTAFDKALNAPLDTDYITINRASIDRNAWSRSNRWIHKQVIEKTAEYNNTIALFDNDYRAKRPIIEFHANVKLFNYGTESKLPVNVIDFNQKDALSNINGSLGFTVDGFTLTEGTKIIFANDTDIDVRNKIYIVNYVDYEGDGILKVQLNEDENATVLSNQIVLVKNGNTLQGKTYYFDGSEWIEAQQKTKINQAPLFDIYDSNDVSYSDSTVYPRSSFAGSKLFAYGTGTGVDDTVLGFPLEYLSIDNIGDIVFTNNLYSDTFTYNLPVTTKNVSDGYVKKFSTRTTSTNEIGWTTSIDEYYPEQIFNFEYDGVSLILDVIEKKNLNSVTTKVYVNDEFINPSEYTITENTSEGTTTITFTNEVTTGADIYVTIISDTASKIGFYDIPKNLENNPFNENTDTFTLGTIRNHYTKLARNIKKLSGQVNGSNNTRDLGAIEKYSKNIIQNSSPIVPMAKFLHNDEFDFFKSLSFNENGYEKFKLKIIDYVNKNDTFGMTAADVLDAALSEINVGKNSANGFYKSDMLPGADKPTVTTYTITAVSTYTFNTTNIYDFSAANNKGILVYLNDVILTKDEDYTVSSTSANITITTTLAVGDIIKIKEYESTIGSYIPNTPTKLGLHPRYVPKKYADDSYTTTTNVIQGHDGSITVAYNDVRDDILLEFENRIYNNIKVNTNIPIVEQDVIPGKFRTTDYTDEEVTSILRTSFLSWVAWNRLDYKTQDYNSTNEFTWNYSTAASSLDGNSLKGNWRGVYKNYYDTDTPHTTPWEMLGISIKPTWWEDEYGPAPYTSGNLVLWEDLEAGRIKYPSGTVTVTKYARQGLTSVIPVDSQGNLISPFDNMVTNYNKVDFRKSWVFGDQGPTETAWRRSSSYRFALQRLYALTKPAKYFALNIDRDKYTYNTTYGQYLLNDRYRINPRSVEIQTIEQSKNSYINWIADYHNNNGCECVQIKNELALTDVRLCYRMASYSDKNYLKIFTDKSSPDSSNTGFQIPDQNFKILLHTNQPLNQLQYSAVIVQRTDDGYSVYGHSKSNPYFEIYKSISDGNYEKLDEYLIPKTFEPKITTVPYGYVFTSKAAVIDFLTSYGAFLESNGLLFKSTENGSELNWTTSAQEFLSWAGQDWGTGAVINLNPSAISLEFNKELLIVDDITKNKIDALDQNGIPLTQDDYSITRLDNSFKIETINNKSINYLKINTVSYEHMIVFDNTSIFNDLIYEPVSGLRQQRLRVVGFTTFDWIGQLDAQGFILNQDNVSNWKTNQYYTRGTIVKYKNAFWSSIKNLQPTTIFEFKDWQKIDYDDIKKGLLSNIANKAGQINEYYNKKTTNLESDVDLLAMGLIGYRPRNYMNSLDDVSRVNFYTGFIGNKGTKTGSEVFKNVKLDKKVTDYELYENWQFKEATFGNSDNKVYLELELDKTKLTNNPAIVEVIDNLSKPYSVTDGPTMDSNSVSSDSTLYRVDKLNGNFITTSNNTSAHQVIELKDLYDQTTEYTNTNIFPIRTSDLTDTNLPTAGYVNSKDADLALFEKTDLNDTIGVTYLSKVTDGTTIWVAKDNKFDWNIYRTDQTSNINTIIENEAGYLDITFYNDHGFVTNDEFIIKDINQEINGYHKVYKRLDKKTVRVLGTVVNPYVLISTDSSVTSDTIVYTTDHDQGSVYKLISVRVKTQDDLKEKYFDNLPIGSYVWVDNNNNNKNSVYEKQAVIGNVSGDTLLITSDTTVITADGNGAWIIKREEQDVVDVSMINKALLYNKETNLEVSTLDYIDPLHGKILGQAKQNIDYITTYDPATYNNDASLTGTVWGKDHVGKIWWDVSNTRFLDYNSSDYDYAVGNWGNLFPGSTVDVRQWIESNVPPSQYSDATVVDQDNYTVISTINSSDTIVQKYYFWVTSTEEIISNKTLSVNNIIQYISSPKDTGIPFISFVNRSTIGIYNSQIDIEDSILHISYNKSSNENNIFNEFTLIQENNKNSFLSDNAFLKLQDSLIGGNKLGLKVPDPNISVARQIGIGFRPRQSMFADRLSALKTYLTYVNTVLSKYIITTNKSFTKLNKVELQPSSVSGEYDKKVATYDELGFQNLILVDVGYKYLVESDENNNGRWSIYEVVTGKTLKLVRVQSYDTSDAWQYIDWYVDTNAKDAIHSDEVDDISKLTSLNLDDDKYVKVKSNSDGKFEIYQKQSGTWVRVGLEDGTIEFKSTLWSGTSTQDLLSVDTDLFTTDNTYLTADVNVGGNELRNVILAINEDLFVDELLIEKNKALIVLFNYILSEQQNIDWLNKTSLIDVEQKVRNLDQYKTYKKDDQTFLLNYLNESKPYHVSIKEFLLKYDGNDQYNADIADFDCPVYYDSTFNKYISPILDYDGVILKSDQSNFDEDGVGLKENDYNIWELDPWNNWFDNRLLSVKSISIANAGSGFTTAPTITFSGGGATTQATATTRINNSGNIIEVILETNGVGYISTPTITLTGDGVNAVLVPIMQNELVRNLKTVIKYDRLEYDYTVVDWVKNTTLRTTIDATDVTVDTDTLTVDSADDVYESGQLVRYNNAVYTHNVTRAFKDKFLLEDFTVVNPDTLSSTNRTMGYYTPTVNQPGLNLALLIKGIDYPGVLVKDLSFNESSGFSVLPYDTSPYDSSKVEEDGSTAYSEGQLDSQIEGSFNDLYLGERPEDIIVGGGDFVDPYSSHAPEELIPGSIYDTLDLTVYTRPSFDYQNNGHGFEIDKKTFEYTSSNTTFSFDKIVEHPISLTVINGTTGTTLHETYDYTIDWVNKEITVIDHAFDGDYIQIQVFEIGGGNQLYRNNYIGSEFGSTLTLPVRADEVYDIVITVNGVLLRNGFTATSDGKLTVDNTLTTVDTTSITVDNVSVVETSQTTLTFIDSYDSSDFLSVTVFGFETTQHDWSFPVRSHFDGGDGADTTQITADSTTVTADNVSTNYRLSNYDVYVGGKNRENAIVELNGKRLRPPEAKRHIADGTTTDFTLPIEGNVDHTSVSNSEIVVFVGNERMILGIDYLTEGITADSTETTVDTTLLTADNKVNEVSFITAPAENEVVDVYITTPAEYTIDNDGVIRIKSSVTVTGTDELDVVTWNDTDQQDILTSTFVGPTTTTETIIELFDSGAFDTVGFSFVGVASDALNLFDLGRTVENTSRLIVTLNGNILLPDVDYSVSGQNLLLAGDIIGPTDIVVVTSFTSNLVPDSIAFKYFKDMRGNTAMYRVNTLNDAVLTRQLKTTDDTIYVNDVSKLAQPNLELGNFGIIMINGERITYREMNTVTNTLTGLRRGTGGTGTNTHSIDSIVENITTDNLIADSEYATTTLTTSTNDSSYIHDNIWYASGASTPSNGISLQNQTTTKANFIKDIYT